MGPGDALVKFLLHANAPTVPTGYGVQIGQLALRLQAAGHEVAFSSTYGVQGATGVWKGMRVYPCGYEVNSNDLLHSHADHFFDGEQGWIITLIDVWAMTSPRLKDYNIVAWTPLDHWPVQPGVLQFFSESQAIPAAMSEWGHLLLQEAGLDAAYIPLSVDTTIYKPTPSVEVNGKPTTGRELFGLPDDAFVVGMVAMNKGWARDRKGFNEAFWAMGQFMRKHDDAYLYMHSERWGGAEGQNLVTLAVHAGIPEHKLIWAGGPDQYAFRLGFTPQMMALTYSMFDVLLAPSHGEGFCVPLIEAQACGVPVIATDFSAQRELVGAGWLVNGQPEWDPAHHAAYVTPFIADVCEQLEEAYSADREGMKEKAIEFAAQYDCDKVFEKYWLPFIESLEAPGEKLSTPREQMPEENAVAVLCPVLNRPENVAPLVESFLATTPRGEATLYFVVEEADEGEAEAIVKAMKDDASTLSTRDEPLAIGWVVTDSAHTFAEKLNVGLKGTTESWVLCIGDDVRFHEGWLDQARKLSSEYDVIGTNDTAGKVKNPAVANGSHADHFFVRRAYVDEHGACLDGPGILAPECYRHWYVDKEIISLAKARGVFSPCLDSIVEHLHPGYDGSEDLRQADPTYMAAVEHSGDDQETFKDRVPLIEMQRTTRARVR
jgi:glycosyltransferase involved in cell wall biosynthesis